ncbi:MAG: hypothetical protein KatS3mg105_0858 [Gemmatales bacterium]|nr:MAG: hypothetical protein KatS3mg105_0858 [Gemmatales bacterium]
MTLQGTVRNGVIVLDPPGQLPEGTRVKVLVEDRSASAQSLRDLLLEFAGSCSGLPHDMAAQHDHYIHGTPKR